MLALEALASLVSRELRDGLHLALVGLLAAAIALQALGELADGPAALLIAAAAALGSGAAVALCPNGWLPSLLTVLSPAPVLFVCLFLFFSDTKELVLPEDEVEAAEIAVPGKHARRGHPARRVPGHDADERRGQIDRTPVPELRRARRPGHLVSERDHRGRSDAARDPAVMTGTYPTHDELPTAADHPDSIFTLLGGDYAMNVAEPVTSVCPQSLCGERARPPASERLDGLASDLRIVYEHLLLPDSMADSLPAVDETFSGFGQSRASRPRARCRERQARARPRSAPAPPGRRASSGARSRTSSTRQRELPGPRRHLRGVAVGAERRAHAQLRPPRAPPRPLRVLPRRPALRGRAAADRRPARRPGPHPRR